MVSYELYFLNKQKGLLFFKKNIAFIMFNFYPEKNKLFVR